MAKSYLALVAALGLARLAGAAKTIDVPDWVVPYDGPKEIEADVGDTIVFTWTGRHNVYIHPTMTCDLTDRIAIGEESGSSHTFTEDQGSPEGTPHFFSCDIGNGGHCKAGQSLTVTVFQASDAASDEALPEPAKEDAPTEDVAEDAPKEDEAPPGDAPAGKTIEVPDWVVPYEGPKELEAVVGDTIVFQWTGGHNVYIHPSMSCDLEGRILVGNDPGSQHTFTEEQGSPEGTEHFFSCDIGNGGHCKAGQHLTVKVFSTAADAASAKAPPAGEPPKDDAPKPDAPKPDASKATSEDAKGTSADAGADAEGTSADAGADAKETSADDGAEEKAEAGAEAPESGASALARNGAAGAVVTVLALLI